MTSGQKLVQVIKKISNSFLALLKSSDSLMILIKYQVITVRSFLVDHVYYF